MKIVDLKFYKDYAMGYSQDKVKVTYKWKGPKTGVVLIAKELWEEASKVLIKLKPPLFLKIFYHNRETYYTCRYKGIYRFVWLYYKIRVKYFGVPKKLKFIVYKGK